MSAPVSSRCTRSAGEAAGRGVALLAVDADVAERAAAGFDEFFRLHEHADGAAGGVVDAAVVFVERTFVAVVPRSRATMASSKSVPMLRSSASKPRFAVVPGFFALILAMSFLQDAKGLARGKRCLHHFETLSSRGTSRRSHQCHVPYNLVVSAPNRTHSIGPIPVGGSTSGDITACCRTACQLFPSTTRPTDTPHPLLHPGRTATSSQTTPLDAFHFVMQS